MAEVVQPGLVWGITLTFLWGVAQYFKTGGVHVQEIIYLAVFLTAGSVGCFALFSRRQNR